MVSQREHKIISTCDMRSRPEDEDEVLMDLYEVADDNAKQSFKSGLVYQPRHKDRISFDFKNCTIQMKRKSGIIRTGTKAKFVKKELSHYGDMKNLVHAGLKLRHHGILKPLICAESGCIHEQIIVGYADFDRTLDDWLQQQHAQAKPRGDYLDKEEKDMVRIGPLCIGKGAPFAAN
ncbi:hypothetical protein ACP70R_050057 [Stipagrostis hirtigluma subsp. patula]